jgi:D-amino peptidase
MTLRSSSKRVKCLLSPLLLFVFAVNGNAQGSGAKKIFMVTDMEGVSGIFDTELQCLPYKSPRWEESRKLLTGEINAAVDGLFDGGATEVVVLDGHSSGQNLSVSDIHPRVRLLTGGAVSPTLELDSSYSALIFVGQHALAGAEKGILGHSYDSQNIQNIWVNERPTGEIGAIVMLAGGFGIPVVMLAGDTAACKELRQLIPQAECAEVKSGVSRTAGFMLSHPASCSLIREKARRGLERLAECKPYRVVGPVEVKVELTTKGNRGFRRREGVEQLNDRTWIFRGKDFTDTWLRFSSF